MSSVKWEYKCVWATGTWSNLWGDTKEKDVSVYLNDMGKDGWELVHYAEHSQFLIFKRQIQFP